tara:strand:+ start:2462 stop:2815 length:354 start_codon:yes stop_codon:yes gene_type:complete
MARGIPKTKIDYHMTEEDDEVLEDIIKSATRINIHINRDDWWIAAYVELPLVNTEALYYPMGCKYGSEREMIVYDMLAIKKVCDADAVTIGVFPTLSDTSKVQHLLILASNYKEEEE